MEDTTVNNTFHNYTTTEIKELHKKLSNLQEPEHIEIFNIIRNYTDKYTVNAYGVHINMSKLSNEALTKIDQFIKFSINNKKKLDNDKEHRKNIMRIIGDQVDTKVNEKCDIKKTIINL